jgi:hypothetical protein
LLLRAGAVGAIEGSRGFKPFRLEEFRQHAGEGGIVVDQKDLGHLDLSRASSLPVHILYAKARSR